MTILEIPFVLINTFGLPLNIVENKMQCQTPNTCQGKIIVINAR